MKIRIFALAKELGMDSKVLIDYCNSAGVKLKNSALASISPEERDIVLNYLKQDGVSDAARSADAPAAPMREASKQVVGKIRSIKTMQPRPHVGRGKPLAAEEPPQIADGNAAVATAEAPDQDSEETEGTATAAPADDADVQLPAADDSGTADKPRDVAAPLSPDDYVSPIGASSRSTIREMRPRGTISDSEARQARRSKGRSKASLPNVAAPPTYKAPKVKSTKGKEEPAQRPDIPLTPEILEQQSPLRAHLRKSAEQRGRRRKSDDDEPFDVADVTRTEETETQPVRRQRRERRRKRVSQDEFSPGGRTGMSRRRRQRSAAPVALKTEAMIESPITIRTLSEAMGRPQKELMRILFDRGQMVSINENISEEIALELALELGVDLTIKRRRDLEDELVEMLEGPDDDANLVGRPPIVTILGHVDHGKTSLLDKIRAENVAGGEAGGITQHIAAYQVEHKGRKLTFVDTPGHAAFGEMRARGANVTDIVVLVVAADDGVMPQTVECISHAKAAGAPIVVAMNKIDLPDANQQKVLQDLAGQEILPAEWGGDTEVVRTSAVTGEGLDELLETLLVTADLHEFKANPSRPAVGVCLEAFRDEGRGALAWLVVQRGTLCIGDVVVCGPAFGRIRAIYDDQDREIEEAGPSTPIRVAGLDMVPGAGDHFHVMSDVEQAREVAESRRHRGRTESLRGQARPRSLEEILDAARGGAVQDLPLIIKADTPGSLEALRGEIHKLDHAEVRVELVHEGVGGVNESDVSLAHASGAIVIAFHVVPEDRALALADREGVDIRRFNIIYEVTDTIKRSLEGLLAPENVEVTTGRALVLQTFPISRIGTIAGCRVLNGNIERSNRVHVIRDQTVLSDYNIASLRREKDDVKEVREGMECGIRLEGFNDVKEGDLLEAFRIEKVKRTLD